MLRMFYVLKIVIFYKVVGCLSKILINILVQIKKLFSSVNS